jgi:predicted phosphodiesterase
MKPIRIIGDVHGSKYQYESIANLFTNANISGSIQVGDMGVGFSQSDHWHESLNTFMTDNNARMIRGNHDNPDMCRGQMVNCIADGFVENNVMYVGGAWSIDRDYRTPGVNWWAAEELSAEQMDQVFGTYCVAKPDVMITHDCPTLAAYHMFVRSGLRTYGGSTLYLTRTGELFQRMFEVHQPKFWFHGHWHHTVERDIDGTHFHCLGEFDWVDFDFANLQYISK